MIILHSWWQLPPGEQTGPHDSSKEQRLHRKLTAKRGWAAWQKDGHGFKAWLCPAGQVTFGNLLSVPEFQSCHKWGLHIPIVTNLLPLPHCGLGSLWPIVRKWKFSPGSLPSLHCLCVSVTPSSVGGHTAPWCGWDLDSGPLKACCLLPKGSRPEVLASLSHPVFLFPDPMVCCVLSGRVRVITGNYNKELKAVA